MDLGAPSLSSAALRATLVDLACLLEAHSTAGPDVTAEVLEGALRAVEPLTAGSRDECMRGLAIESFVASALTGLIVAEGRAGAPADVEWLLDEVERRTGVSRFATTLRIVGEPSLLALPLPTAIEVCTGLMRALAPVHEVCFWLREAGPDARRAPQPDGFEIVEVARWHRPCATIAWIPRAGAGAECRAIAERCAAVLGPAFERASLTQENAARVQALKETTERRLTRLGFDLHDGALQDISLLAGQLDGLRRAMDQSLAGHPDHDGLVTRLEDIRGLVDFLDADLRGLASTIDLPGMLRKPFSEALDAVVRTFAARSDIEPDVVVTGDPATISDSQRIALLRIVQESLSNVREHSHARSVKISVAARSTHMEASITDDGLGFDVEEALRRAARNGRMGLLGMTERVRLLGGTFDIVSRPGAGTTITFTVARWIPTALAADPAGAERATYAA